MPNANKLSLNDQDITGLKQLWDIGLSALSIKPPLYIRSILGSPKDWFFKQQDSEFTAADPYAPIRTFKYAVDLLVPALPRQAPVSLPPLAKRLFWRPTRLMFNPDQNQNPTTFPEESWFFINGICTNEHVARMNAGLLSKLFHRPIQIVQNATDGALVDLVECAIGKGLSQMTEPARKAYPVILAALENPDKERVVVVCHSQGTIIMANVLRALKSHEFKSKLYADASHAPTEQHCTEPAALEDDSLLSKLEIYAFANCATTLRKVENQDYPYIESFANEHDIVARLGCICPDADELGIDIDGPIFERKGMWGHLLNIHHLFGMRDHLEGGKANPYTHKDGLTPRLYKYYQGKKP